MPTFTPSATERLPRLTRPPETSGRTRLIAALGVAGVIAHLLFAQFTLLLTVCGVVTSRTSRWRPLWLAVPAAAGLVWTAALGIGRAAAGFVAGPRQIAGYLARAPGHPAALAKLPAAFAGAGHWLPRQLPLALLAAAAETAVTGWAARRAGESAAPGYRAGLILTARRRRTTAVLAAGGVVTRDGVGLGLDTGTGRMAELPWAAAEGGVLVTGNDRRMLARACFPVACAALRRRKSVVVIDLTGSTWLARSLAALSEGVGAPLASFSSAGPFCYEPFRGYPPGQAARLAGQLIDWSAASEQQCLAGQRWLAEAFAVLAASGAAGAGQAALLDQLIALLDPAARPAAAAGISRQLPHRDVVARRLSSLGAALQADPAAAAALRDQLRRLRASGPGRWLLPAAPPEAISISAAMADRRVTAFWLAAGPGNEPAAMIARLAVADLAATLSGLRDLGLRGDGLVWLHGCEALPRPAAAELITLGGAAGTAVLLSTADPQAAAGLVTAAGVTVASGPADPELAARLADLAEPRDQGRRAAAADTLRWQEEDEFAVIAAGAGPRFRPACRSVPGPWSGPR